MPIISPKKVRRHFTPDPRVMKMADALMKLRAFPTLTSLFEQLVREEIERRNGIFLFADTDPGLVDWSNQRKTNPEIPLPPLEETPKPPGGENA